MNEVWNIVFSKFFSAKDGDSIVLALAEFGGEFYIGVGQSSPSNSANVYCLTDSECKKWEKVTPPWSSATGGDRLTMAVFKNRLYIATDHGEVWRTTDGKNWSNATGNLPLVGRIDVSIEFKGYLYITTNTAIWRTSNGSSWEFVIDLSSKDQKIYDIWSVEVFNNYLYAGIGLKYPEYVNVKGNKILVNRKGIQLWKTLDGKKWNKFQEVIEPPGGVLGVNFYPEHVYALKVFYGHLYLGEYHGSGLYRTDGSAKSWEYIPNVISKGTGSVFRLMPHAGKFYLGVSHLASPDTPGLSGSPLLYSSKDGTNWTSVDKCPKLDKDVSSITSLLSFKGRLYAGTANPSKSGLMKLWELGPEIVPDKFDPNDTMETATLVQLGSTKTQTTTEFPDLTLLEYGIDFFKIEYQSTEECWHDLKVSPVYPTGTFGLEKFNGSLSIFAQEEYCKPLILQIYNSEGKLYKKFKTANEVHIYCPSQIFKDKKLYLAIRNPNGNSPVRYKLSVKFSNRYGRIVGKLLHKFWEYLPPPYPPPPFHRLFDPAAKYFDATQFLAESENLLSKFIEYRSRIDRAHLDHELGQTTHLVGMHDDAERLYKQSLIAFQEMGIKIKEADILRNLGELYSVLGRPGEAIENLERACQLHEKAEEFSGLAWDWISLGRHYFAEGESAKALAALDEAFGFQVSISDKKGLVLNLIYQSETFLSLEWQDATVACIILAENLSSGIEDSTLHHVVEQSISCSIAQIGEKKYFALKNCLARQADTVRTQAMTKIFGQ